MKVNVVGTTKSGEKVNITYVDYQMHPIGEYMYVVEGTLLECGKELHISTQDPLEIEGVDLRLLMVRPDIPL